MQLASASVVLATVLSPLPLTAVLSIRTQALGSERSCFSLQSPPTIHHIINDDYLISWE